MLIEDFCLKMKTIILITFAVISLIFIACHHSRKVTTIPEGSFLVDVRTPDEFKDGSVLNAVNIPLDEVPNRIEDFSGKSAIVVFCRSGNRSGKAKKVLVDNGIQNVINGGSWQNVRDCIKQKSNH